MSAALLTGQNQRKSFHHILESERFLLFIDEIIDHIQKDLRNRFQVDFDSLSKSSLTTVDAVQTEQISHNSSDQLPAEILILLHTKIGRLQKEYRFAKRHLAKYSRLTPREKEIIQLLVEGHNNPEIAKKLFISRSTVEQHRKNINSKLEIKSFVQLIRYAQAFDLA